MSPGDLTHISEILDGWSGSPWAGRGEAGASGTAGGEAAHESRLPGGQRWRVLTAGVLVVLLGAALLVFTRSPAQVTERPAPAATEAPPLAAAIVSDAGRALEAWGRFAVTGHIRVFEPWFAADGPQAVQLRAEAQLLAAAPIGGAAYDFVLESPEVTEVGLGAATVRSGVVVQRPGEEPQHHRWDIEMRWDAARVRWVLWTVRSAP